MTTRTYFLARFSTIPDMEMAGELAGFIRDSRIIGSPGMTLTIFVSDEPIEKLTEIIALSETHFFLLDITDSDVAFDIPKEVMNAMSQFIRPIVKNLITIDDRIKEKQDSISKQVSKELQIEQLEKQIQAAVDDEDFLRAADLKKRLDELKKEK